MKTPSFRLTFISLTALAVSANPFFWSSLSQSLASGQQLAQTTSLKSTENKHELIEEFGFQLENYAYGYQRQENVINIDVLYRYVPGLKKSEYPNVVAIKQDLEAYIQNYPDKYQYWEFLNKDTTQMIMDKYTALASIKVKFQMFPNAKQPFSRTSIVTLTRS